MQFAKLPLLSCTLTATVLVGSLVIAPFAVSAEGAQLNSPNAPRGSTTDVRFAHTAFSIRLEDQLLATLRYLPVKFVPAPSTTSPTTTTTVAPTTTTTVPATTTTVATPAIRPRLKSSKKASPTTLRRGSFVWRFPKIVGPLRSLWTVGTDNVVLQGALMNFQAVHGLSWNTGMTAQTWQLILQAATKKQYDPNNYNYVVVSQVLPEKLMLYVNGHHVYNSFVNTGVSQHPRRVGRGRCTRATP